MCEYCEIENSFESKPQKLINIRLPYGSFENMFLWSAIDRTKRQLKLHIDYMQLVKKDEYSLKINYCPMCGKKL